MTTWPLMVAALAGRPLPTLPELPGRVHVMRDEPLTEADLAQITDLTELALCAGITRQAAWARLQKRKEDPS
ncbi:MAG: hypothetical protein JNL30_01105 [Rubrivivax sp.]|nr:hypothetical protein [Rubrivivax sp.]